MNIAHGCRGEIDRQRKRRMGVVCGGGIGRKRSEPERANGEF